MLLGYDFGDMMDNEQQEQAPTIIALPDTRENLLGEFHREYDALIAEYPEEMAFIKDFIIGVLESTAFVWAEREDLKNAVAVIRKEAISLREIRHAKDHR